jgi:hypothetical protein
LGSADVVTDDPRWLGALAGVLGCDEADIVETTGTHVLLSDGEWRTIAGGSFRGHVLAPWKRPAPPEAATVKKA